jgi:DNA-binding CsgD family transcriptional regulator
VYHITESQLANYNNAVLLLHDCDSLATLGSTAMQGIRQLVPYDSGVFLQTNNPGTYGVGSSLVMDIDPHIMELYERHYQQIDPARLKVASYPLVPSVLRISDLLDYNAWAKTEVRSDLWLPNNIYHIAAVFVSNKGLFSALIDIFRNRRQPDFSDDEMTLLTLYHSQIQATYNRLQMAGLNHNVSEIIQHSSQGVCILNDRLEYIYLNDFAKYGLEKLELSAKLKYICANIAKANLGADMKQELVTEYNLKITFHFFPFKPDDHSAYWLLIFSVTEASISPANEGGEKLTNREREVVTLLVQGKSNKEIGAALYISIDTVKAHLKKIYGKTGTTSRVGLATYMMRNLPNGKQQSRFTP